jgi:hypothetical protein
VHAAGRAGGPGLLSRSLVYLPENASPAKVDKLRARGAALALHGDDCLLAETEARRVAGERGMEYVSPYNDWEVGGGLGGRGERGMEFVSPYNDWEVGRDWWGGTGWGVVWAGVRRGQWGWPRGWRAGEHGGGSEARARWQVQAPCSCVHGPCDPEDAPSP